PACSDTLYSNTCNHCFIMYQAKGVAIKNAIPTCFANDEESMRNRFSPLAPNTFRMPSSFVLRWMLWVARPNKPRHATKILNAPPNLKIMAERFSFAYMIRVVDRGNGTLLANADRIFRERA